MPSIQFGSRRCLTAPLVLASVICAATFHEQAAVAAAPSVTTMVVSRTSVLLAPRPVQASAFSISVSGRSCTVGEGTPLAALKATGLSFHVKDFGQCGSAPESSAALFLDRIGSATNTGTSGWSYKVNDQAGTTGAADPTGPFGTGVMQADARVLWFWCVFDANWACQRTLSITAPQTATRGKIASITVNAFDDAGKAVRAAKVKVTAGRATAITNGSGVASLRMPSTAGSVSVTAVDSVAATASRPQRVRSFPVSIKVA